jgi:hypothetical protein
MREDEPLFYCSQAVENMLLYVLKGGVTRFLTTSLNIEELLFCSWVIYCNIAFSYCRSHCTVNSQQQLSIYVIL